ncbi:MAG: PQ-loop repeat-containing protein [Acidobacteriota bacterium]
MTEIIGWIGTALVIVAYYPQIQHLFVEKCAWGISVATWMIWLVSSVLLLTYAWMQREMLFILVQIANILAIVTTIILVRRSNRICPFHASMAAAAAKQAPV